MKTNPIMMQTTTSVAFISFGVNTLAVFFAILANKVIPELIHPSGAAVRHLFPAVRYITHLLSNLIIHGIWPKMDSGFASRYPSSAAKLLMPSA